MGADGSVPSVSFELLMEKDKVRGLKPAFCRHLRWMPHTLCSGGWGPLDLAYTEHRPADARPARLPLLGLQTSQPLMLALMGLSKLCYVAVALQGYHPAAHLLFRPPATCPLLTLACTRVRLLPCSPAGCSAYACRPRCDSLTASCLFSISTLPRLPCRVQVAAARAAADKELNEKKQSEEPGIPADISTVEGAAQTVSLAS